MSFLTLKDISGVDVICVIIEINIEKKTKKNGTGLGLAISKKIIEDHYGEINIESSDKGTKVNIKFPINNN